METENLKFLDSLTSEQEATVEQGIENFLADFQDGFELGFKQSLTRNLIVGGVALVVGIVAVPVVKWTTKKIKNRKQEKIDETV